MDVVGDSGAVERPAPIEIPTAAGRLVVRLATRDDDAGLRRLFSSITMDAALALRVDREPDFFALYDVQGGNAVWEPWIGELDGEIVGLGTLMARDAYIDGERTRVGYLGDLRLDPRVRGREVLSAIYGRCLDGFADRHGVSVFYTAVIASNSRAVQALTGPKAREIGIPEYHLLQEFDIRAVQTLTARTPTKTARAMWRVRSATSADIPAIARLLDERARDVAFGEPVDGANALEQRIARWPGLRIEHFHLVERGGTSAELVGCLAPWDATPVKQTVVTGYSGSMRWIKRAYNAAAAILRAPRLPAPGSAMRYAYATHHVVPVDPDAANLLVHDAWRAVRAADTGLAFLSCRAPRGALHGSAPWRGFVTNDLPANLYAVVPHGGELPPELAQAPHFGFEMALV